MYKIKRIFEFIVFLCFLTSAKLVSVFMRYNEKYKDLWIVSERGTDARDNGYHFFKFLTQEHPDINSVYIISRNSPDYGKVASLGKVIQYRSFSHYLHFLLAKVRVSTHIEGYSPDILFFYKYGKRISGNAKKVFLQHGIIKDDLEFCHAEHTNIDMFVCSAVPEYEYIDKVFGYPEGVLRLTGLCRYDNLRRNDKLTRKILFMPTWRSTFRSCSRHTFSESEYCKRYNSLLNNSELAELLEKYDYELIFYPHNEVQRFLDCFAAHGDRVTIAGFETNDVQQLLINTDILITDYSSVYFDYAYMRKPVIYYQYDEAKFRAEQYSKGYFDYRRDGFGRVLETEDEVISELRHLLDNQAKPDMEYLKRMNSFFKFNDTNNCKRTFEAISSL